MIVIIDYGLGNARSILNMLRKIGVEAIISSNTADIEKAHKLILPGVGALKQAMINLNDLGLVSVLNKKVIIDKTPILGICLGLQLFTKRSEEGNINGLGWIDAETVRFKFDKSRTDLKIPHMGWNLVDVKKKSHIFDGSCHDSRFYFVHSYHLLCENEQDILSVTTHGYEFASSIERGNIFGVQFHPEKSHKFGMKLLKNFVDLI